MLRADGRLVFPAATARALDLSRYRGCNVYLDEHDPARVALQLMEEGGDYSLWRKRGENRYVLNMARAARRAGAKAGRYRLYQDGDLWVIDLSRPWERR